MKQQRTIISWNVNGLRAVIQKNLFLSFIKKYKPDILCLQETKAEKNQVLIDLPKYEEYWNSAKKKGYSGTAIFTEIQPEQAIYNLPDSNRLVDKQGRDANAEGRVVTLEFEKYYVVSVYTPNAKDTLERLPFRFKYWDPLFLQYIKKLETKKPVIFCGDLNVAHQEIDLARPKENAGNKGFTTEERAGFDKIIKAGFIDTFRDKYPDKKGAYSWWTHWANARARNVGWRIDYICVSKKLKKYVVDAFILPEVFGSDHCPVGITIAR